ncbi:MAG: SRPBCC family protein, partial [Pseudomonadota bacterium]|nr:SRPBCC family protein [Pseudomonadota bacterium]
SMRDIIRIRFFLAFLTVMPASPAGSQTIPDGLIIQELERAQTEPDSATEVVIDAPVNYVFTFLTTRLHEYVADATALEFDHSGSLRSDQLGEGSVRTATMQNGELLVQRFLLMAPPREFAYHTDMQRSTLEAPLQYSVGRYRLTELNKRQTRLNVSVTYRATSRLFGFIVRRAFSSALRRDFDRAAGIISNAYIEENAS